MTAEKICEIFERSKDRQSEIRKIAKETGIDEETIIEVLKDAGLCVSHERCRRCRKIFPVYLSAYCPKCEKEQKEEIGRRAWIEWQIRQNEAKRASLLRKMIVLDLENQKLREAMK